MSSSLTIRPTLGPTVARCLGVDCVDRDLCARYRDSMDKVTGVTTCFTSLIYNSGYPCPYLISTVIYEPKKQQQSTCQQETAT
jgi:hypothetical protein